MSNKRTFNGHVARSYDDLSEISDAEQGYDAPEDFSGIPDAARDNLSMN
jgi:hypothetical protein